jgi:hypothetical protein
VKISTLSYGFFVNDRRVTLVTSATGPSLSDGDALIFDPKGAIDEIHRMCSSQNSSTASLASPRGQIYYDALQRRRIEVSELLRKGGIVVVLLRFHKTEYKFIRDDGSNPSLTAYSILDQIPLNGTLYFPHRMIVASEGKNVRKADGKKSCGKQFLQLVGDSLSYSAILPLPSEYRKLLTVLATDSVGNPIAIEFESGSGRIVFLPVSDKYIPNDLVDPILETIYSHYGGSADLTEPDWVKKISVVSSTQYDGEINDIARQTEELRIRSEVLIEKRDALQRFKHLLFGTGRAALEPAVREAFRLFGFNVPEEKDYPEPCDAFLIDPEGKTALCEVEGSENQIRVGKYRQLLDYIQAEALKAALHKGILIGNGFRNEPLQSDNRKAQFSDHVLNGCRANGYVVVPSTELFEAVNAVLARPDSVSLKAAIRSSIMTTVGLWAFSAVEIDQLKI